MNNKIIELHEIQYPEKYDTNFILTYPMFNNELKDLVSKSGNVKEFKKKYYKSLRFLEQLKKNCIMQSRLFELLQNSDKIYSIRLKGDMNIRILFDFQIVYGKEVAILYNCFQKKSTKDYAIGISLAKDRRKEIIGD